MNTNYLIILLNYNNWLDTIECIFSLKNSGVNDANILVIENCSSDDSLVQLRTKTPDIKIIVAKKNLGFTGGNNVGIKYAFDNNYEYAIVLNNDTIVESEDSIRILIDEMDKNPYITLGTGRIFYYPEKDKIWYDGGEVIKWRASELHYNFRKNKKDVELNDNLRTISFISGCYMCLRLRDLPTLGYMDENLFIYLDDLEYSTRAAKLNLKLLYIPKAEIYHKARGEDQHSPRMVYYVIRNRRIVINLHFGIITKVYFELVLIAKRIIWSFTNKKYYRILNYAINDYNKKYFGQAPEYIK